MANSIPETLELPLTLPAHPARGELARVPIHEVPDESADVPGDLQRSIELNGLFQPIALVRGPDGRYHFGAGRRRARAIRRAGHPDVPALVFHADTPERLAATITLVENLKRGDNPASELDAIESLARTAALSEEEIARALGLPLGTVRKRLRLQSLAPELRAAFREGRIAPTVATAAAGLSATRQGELVDRLEEAGKITAADVHAARFAARAAAVAELPADIFACPALPSSRRADPWAATRAGLKALIASLPELPERPSIHDHLAHVLRLVPAAAPIAA